MSPPAQLRVIDRLIVSCECCERKIMATLSRLRNVRTSSTPVSCVDHARRRRCDLATTTTTTAAAAAAAASLRWPSLNSIPFISSARRRRRGRPSTVDSPFVIIRPSPANSSKPPAAARTVPHRTHSHRMTSPNYPLWVLWRSSRTPTMRLNSSCSNDFGSVSLFWNTHFSKFIQMTQYIGVHGKMCKMCKMSPQIHALFRIRSCTWSAKVTDHFSLTLSNNQSINKNLFSEQ